MERGGGGNRSIEKSWGAAAEMEKQGERSFWEERWTCLEWPDTCMGQTSVLINCRAFWPELGAQQMLHSAVAELIHSCVIAPPI